ASAATSGWMVSGTNFTTGTKAIATTAAVDKEGELTAAGITINCKSKVLNGIAPQINGATGMGDANSLVFNECEIQEGKGTPPCTLATKTIGTLPVLVDLTLDGATADKGRFLPTNTSKIFATIKYEGPECPLKGVQPVNGAAT